MAQALRQVGEHELPSGHYICLACLGMPVGELARAAELRLGQWKWPPGRPPASGVAFELPSGPVVALLEYEYSPRDPNGPEIYVGIPEARERGSESLLAEILDALGLDTEAVSWRQRPETVHEVWQALEAFREC